MEDVLELYAEPYDPVRPVVCFDVAIVLMARVIAGMIQSALGSGGGA